MSDDTHEFFRWRPHPWHGLDPGPDPPGLVNVYVEITPFDSVKYEMDKRTGFLRVDRPQAGASLPPALYGFVPGTYCGERVSRHMPEAEKGDGDPLDICVVSERPINRAEVVLVARVVGGLPMLDGGEADDKIIAVLDGDPIWGHVEDLEQLPPGWVKRLDHYFSTYKMIPGSTKVKIGEPYGRERAEAVVKASIEDYSRLPRKHREVE